MEIQKYIDNYISWLKSEITYSEVGEYCEINTPFLDNNNDYLQIYVKQDGNEIFFSDDGTTLNELEMDGFKLTPARKQQLIYTLNQYGVSLNGYELSLKAPANEFAKRKHAFIQCLLKINDMYMLSHSRVTSVFFDDVIDFFHQKDIYPVENVQFVGKSGFYHNYDFVLQKTRNNQERICLTVNNANKSTIGNIIFSWNDTKPSRKNSDSQLLVIMNDNNFIGKGAEEALNNYEIKSIRWSKRNDQLNINILTA